MRLARKLTLALVLGVFFVLAISAWVLIRRESRIFEADVRRDARTMGRALSAAIVAVWETEGETRALRLVEQANERESAVDIKWVWLDALEGPHTSRLPSHVTGPVAQGREVVHKLQRDGAEILVTAVPVRVGGVRPGALEISESLAGEQQYIRNIVANTLLSTGLVAIVCAGIASAVGVWFVGRPMRALIEQARRIGSGDLTQRLGLAQRDEVGELATEMNRMCDHLVAARERLASEAGARIEALQQLRHAERLATVGKLASGIAHELGTPLQIVTGRARMIADGDVASDEVPVNARIVVDQAKRMASIIRELLDFARRRDALKARSDLRTVVRDSCALLGPLAQRAQVEILQPTAPDPVELDLDAEQLQQALTNVLINAVQSMPEGGTVTVEVLVARKRPPADHGGEEGEFAAITVTDRGCGMSPAVLDQVFEPFFTTKPVGEGTGLGLSVAYGIVKEHGGWIQVASNPGAGSKFSIFLPRGV